MKIKIALIVVFVIAAIVLVVGLIGTRPSNAASQHSPTRGCVMVETHVKGWADMPYQYSLIFCGNFIIDQLLTCPTGEGENPMYPAEVFNCTSVKYFPTGFPSWMHPPVPGGF